MAEIGGLRECGAGRAAGARGGCVSVKNVRISGWPNTPLRRMSVAPLRLFLAGTSSKCFEGANHSVLRRYDGYAPHPIKLITGYKIVKYRLIRRWHFQNAEFADRLTMGDLPLGRPNRMRPMALLLGGHPERENAYLYRKHPCEMGKLN